ncbi:invasin domain 3-containing protein [Maribacter sp. 2308TA10-17]|uniref:invasin domain 3-containing protein n=1 Tax=Maribacter sp. 2308TA10-17 TaxID=3386276 RepID=UPI0039BC9EBF
MKKITFLNGILFLLLLLLASSKLFAQDPGGVAGSALWLKADSGLGKLSSIAQTTNSSAVSDSGGEIGQTFTVLADGEIVGVEIVTNNGPTGSAILEIWEGPFSGAGAGTMLQSQTFTMAGAGTYAVSFNPEAVTTTGTTSGVYSFKYIPSSGSAQLRSTSTDVYAGGRVYGNAGPFATSLDAVFKVTIVPAIEDPVLDTEAAEVWYDQSGNDHYVTAVAGQQPVLETNSLNFNPVMDFDGTDDQMTNPASPFASGVSDETNIFFVAREDARQNNSIFGFNPGNGTGNRYQSHHIYPDGTVYFDGGNPSTDDRVSGPSGLAIGSPHVAGYFNSVSGNNQAIDINGANVASDTSGESQALGETRIGTADNDTFQYFNGDIAEFIAYDTDNSATNKQQIQSYLAIKYGITLDNGATAYLSSDGATVWAVDATYDSDIFGIAKDDDSSLDQQISKSVNTGSVLTLSNDTNFTGANGTHASLTGGQYLVVGNNGESATGLAAGQIPTGLNAQIARIWKAQNTGSVGAVNLSFEISDPTIRTYSLLKVNNSTDFSAATPITGTVNGNTIEFTNVTLNDSDNFTLGVIQISPGDVAPGLALWLKADSGVTGTTVTGWDDQSGNIRTETITGTPTFEDNTINFNPSVVFDPGTANDATDYLEWVNFTSAYTEGQAYIVKVHNNDPAVTDAEGGYWGLGNETVLFSDSNLYEGFGSRTSGETGRLVFDPTFDLEIPHLYTSDISAAGTRNLRVNAETLNSDTQTVNFGTGSVSLGRTSANSGGQRRGFGGRIAEFIVYGTDNPSGTDELRIESYLAIKYGITLNSGTTAYLASDGSTVWPVDATYDSDIFGIAKDDDSSLDQQISKSVNTGAVLTLSNDTNFTGANGTHVSLTDGQFLIVGNDAGSTTTTVATGVPATLDARYERQWKAANTGSVGAVNLSFDINASTLRTYELIINGAASSIAGTVNGTSVEFAGVTLSDGDIFSVGFTQVAPGAVAPSLALWLKADDGVTGGSAVSQWDDRSGNSNNAVQADAAKQPDATVNMVNFNPSITFSGDTAEATADILTTSNTLSLSDNASIFTVFTRPAQAAGNSTYRAAFASQEFWGATSMAAAYWLGLGSDNREIRATGPTSVSGVTGQISGTNPTATNTGPLLNSLINTSTSLELFANGESDGTKTTAVSTGTPLLYEIGQNSAQAALGFSRAYAGDITEIIAYNKSLSGTERQQVESYLAIKYGVTLNDGATAYLDSQGNNVWPVDATYTSDIFGIANDAKQALNQQISRSINDEVILTVSTDTNFTGANGTHTSLTDGQYLLIGNDGASGAVADAISTDLDSKYFTRTAREWKSVNMGTIAGAMNLQFDGYDDSWVLLTRTTDGDFSAATGTTETALSATGTVALALPGTTYFTLAQKATSIEFELATANDVEATGGNLPNLLIDGTLNENTLIDVIINATGTATIGTDYTLGGEVPPLPKTISVNIPAGTYTSTTPVALSSLNFGDRLRSSYPSLANGPTTQREETFVPKFSGTYQLTYAAETFSSAGTPNGFPRIGTTSGVTDGSSDVFNGSTDRIDTGTPSKTYDVILIAGTTYYVYSLAGGGTTMTNVTMNLEYLVPIDFAITDENLVEADETIDLTLSNAQSGLTIQEIIGGALIDNHVYTITNDDTVGIEFATATGASNDEATADNFVQFLVNGESTTALTFDLQVTVAGTAIGGGTDYTFTSPTTVTIPANTAFDGTTATALNLTGFSLNDDMLIEANETVVFEITNPSNGLSEEDANGDTSVTPTFEYTITDDDEPVISIAATSDGAEPATAAVFTVSIDGGLINGTGADITGTLALSGMATAGDDYTDMTNFVIADGASSAVINIPVLDDTEVEGTETLIATISAPSRGTVNATANIANGNIVDDDAAGFTVTPTTMAINENGGTDTFTVVLTAQPISDVVLDITSADTNEATVDNAQLTFTSADWDTPQTITVTGVDDITVATDNVALTVAVNDAGSDDAFDPLLDQMVDVTLNNDDIAIGAMVSNTALVIDENGGTATFTVVLGSQPATDVLINLVSGDVLEATVDIAQLTFNGTDWDKPQTITVTGIDDSALTGDTTVITVSVDPTSDGAFTGFPNQTVDVTLVNDDISTNGTGTTIAAADGAGIADGADMEIITVQLKDDDRLDVKRAGINVTFAVTGSAMLSSATATTDVNGTATITITNTAAETVDVTATVDTDNDGGTTPEVMVASGSPAQVVFAPDNANPDPTNNNTTLDATSPILADGTSASTVDIRLADTNGNALTASGGSIVIMSTGNAQVISVVDNGDGTYTAMVSNTTAETVTLTGELNGVALTDEALVVFEPDNANPDVYNTNTTITTTGTVPADGLTNSTITVQLADANGNLLTASGGTVTLATTSATAMISSVVDNGDGTYTATVNNTVEEIITITGQLDGVAIQNTADVEFGVCLLNCDTDDDGDCNLNCDTDGDGDCDLNCDTNGDGDCDLNCDSDGDGNCDLNCDTDGDGACDLNCDIDGDGDCDMNCDTDGDGDCDINCDVDGDGSCDLNCDTDGDGDCDLNCDTDGDGQCDLNCDDDGDGNCELNCDTDGDGEPDTNVDTDGDGVCDYNCEPNQDADGDGVPDSEECPDFPNCRDTDGDGIPDYLDSDDDGDGVPNNEEDANGDGDLTNDDCDNDGVPNYLDGDACSISAKNIATAFTPNGDGMNDAWVIQGIENFPNSLVKVYNRYGHEVFGAKGYQNNWGGNYKDNSKMLPPGSYYYVINLGDGSEPLDGWMFINY